MSGQRPLRRPSAPWAKRSPATLLDAVSWIAYEDSPADSPPVEEVEGMLTVALVADLWQVSTRAVAEMVVMVRKNFKQSEVTP